MLCYSLYCFFLVFCILKLWDRELNYVIKCYKMYNYGSIIKLFLKELKFIIMYSMLENYIFYLFILCFEVNCVFNNFFKLKYF